MRVLVGDIGGTHARMAVVEITRRKITMLHARTYPSRAYSALAPIAREFLAEVGNGFERACFGVACPVVGGDCTTPNLPWSVSAARIAAEIGIARTRVINDLDAVAYGIGRLEAADVVTLQEGTPVEHGVIAIIGAGTGLGQAYLVWDQGRYRPLASEGGHASFAASDPLEWALQRWLTARYGHVSYERVLSGPGLVSLYHFLAEREPARVVPAVHADVEREGGAAISRHALEGRDALCREALALFARVYGGQAGNLALTVLATGGVYVVGGIAPRILDALRDGAFLAAFRAKGRMGGLLARVPVHVVINPSIGLFGAAVAATDDVDLPESPDVARSTRAEAARGC
ncbi:MAG TPA: glucokinase [Gemmatimonadaceae bacterium]|nr:glucokinase [Gemmatimonadaceae bacterium]